MKLKNNKNNGTVHEITEKNFCPNKFASIAAKLIFSKNYPGLESVVL